MKTFLIMILSFALAGGAWLSKPSEQSLRAMVKQKAEAELKADRTVFDVILKKKDPAEQLLSELRFKDHVLWVTVERDGKTVYTGAFNTWFASDWRLEKATS